MSSVWVIFTDLTNDKLEQKATKHMPSSQVLPNIGDSVTLDKQYRVVDRHFKFSNDTSPVVEVEIFLKYIFAPLIHKEETEGKQ